jgi:hypothetical protein
MSEDKEKQAEISQRELGLKREEFLAAERRKEEEAAKAKKFKLDPVLATIIAALIGFSANTVGTFVNNSNNNALEQRKFESDLIKKALDASTPEDKIKDLRLLLTLKLVHNDNLTTALDEFLKDTSQAIKALTGSQYTPLSTDARKHFFEEFKREFADRTITAKTEHNLSEIFDFISTDTLMKDSRYIAYVLASIAHETSFTFQPTTEIGVKKNENIYDGKLGNTEPGDGYKYRGRGYVQVVFKDNYRVLNDALGLTGTEDDIVENPDKLLNPVIAYRASSYAMVKGTFTGKKLGDYIHDTVTDYVKARKVINGYDQTVRIASYASKFEKILKACLEIDRTNAVY